MRSFVLFAALLLGSAVCSAVAEEQVTYIIQTFTRETCRTTPEGFKRCPKFVAALEPALEVKNDAFVPSAKLDDVIEGVKKTSDAYNVVAQYLRKRDFEPLRVQAKRNYQAFAYRRIVGQKHMLVLFQEYRRVNKRVTIMYVRATQNGKKIRDSARIIAYKRMNEDYHIWSEFQVPATAIGSSSSGSSLLETDAHVADFVDDVLNDKSLKLQKNRFLDCFLNTVQQSCNAGGMSSLYTCLPDLANGNASVSSYLACATKRCDGHGSCLLDKALACSSHMLGHARERLTEDLADHIVPRGCSLDNQCPFCSGDEDGWVKCDLNCGGRNCPRTCKQNFPMPEYRCSDYPSCYCQANATFVERSCRCYVKNVGVVSDAVCQSLQVMRPAVQRPCEQTTCIRVIKPEWKLSDFSECQCGKTKCWDTARVRSVTCQNPLNGAVFLDQNCAGPKPDVTQRCTRDDCCGTWVAGTKCVNGQMDSVCRTVNNGTVEDVAQANQLCDDRVRPKAQPCDGSSQSQSSSAAPAAPASSSSALNPPAAPAPAAPAAPEPAAPAPAPAPAAPAPAPAPAPAAPAAPASVSQSSLSSESGARAF